MPVLGTHSAEWQELVLSFSKDSIVLLLLGLSAGGLCGRLWKKLQKRKFHICMTLKWMKKNKIMYLAIFFALTFKALKFGFSFDSCYYNVSMGNDHGYTCCISRRNSGETIGTTELRLEIKGRTIRLQTFPVAFALQLSAYCPCAASLPFKAVSSHSRQIWLHGDKKGVYRFQNCCFMVCSPVSCTINGYEQISVGEKALQCVLGWEQGAGPGKTFPQPPTYLQKGCASMQSLVFPGSEGFWVPPWCAIRQQVCQEVE